MAKILLPLTTELKGDRKGAETLNCTTLMQDAFNYIKAALMKSVCLAFLAELALAIDVSAMHVAQFCSGRRDLLQTGGLGIFLSQVGSRSVVIQSF